MSNTKGDDPDESNGKGASTGPDSPTNGQSAGEWGPEADAALARRARDFQASSLDLIDLAHVHKQLGRSLQEFTTSGMWLGQAGRQAFWYRWKKIRDRADEHQRRLEAQTTG